MSRYLLVGTPGNPGLTLIDLQDRTIETVGVEAIDESIARARAAGATVFRGVDVAIAIEERHEAVGRFFFDGGTVR